MGLKSRGSLLRWAALVLPAAAFFAATVRGPLSDPTYVHPRLAFWLVLVITALCAIGAVVVAALGWRRRLAEVTILGSALLAVSVLPMVHALTIPGVLYEANDAVVVAAFVAVPVALAIAFPLILPGLALSRAVARRWRPWSIATGVAVAALATTLLIEPDAVAAPRPNSPPAIVVIAVSLAGTLSLAARHLRLYRIGRRRASLVAAAAFGYLGLSTLVFLVERPFSVGWWGAHAVDAIGIFGAIFGLAFAHARDRTVAFTLAPVVNRDPLVALELGLTPPVHDFISALERKDRVTRDHVVRVGELAMRTGVRAGLGGAKLRTLGLGALLHDIGKLAVPDEVLKKPGRLTESEFETIKEHTVRGAELIRSSQLLAPAANLVRWHHERADGGGYPDGLGADQLPIEVGIISVCDAWDAMTSTRPYREAMAFERGREILREGAGSQWTERSVELTIAELEQNGPVRSPVYDGVGRRNAGSQVAAGSGGGGDMAAVCQDAIPVGVRISLGLDSAAHG